MERRDYLTGFFGVSGVTVAGCVSSPAHDRTLEEGKNLLFDADEGDKIKITVELIAGDVVLISLNDDRAEEEIHSEFIEDQVERTFTVTAPTTGGYTLIIGLVNGRADVKVQVGSDGLLPFSN